MKTGSNMLSLTPEKCRGLWREMTEAISAIEEAGA